MRSVIAEPSLDTREVKMKFTQFRKVKTTTDVVSGILNWICPECGGRMGGRGKEFKCQGECQTDWRLIWAACCRGSSVNVSAGAKGNLLAYLEGKPVLL
jgi:hypothetical protein